ncbi:paraquat-inducible protein A [Algisphaera agarilytica]|uniref:Paraquat-inducible protein A n=1 Tax=Algisphaera agarilytica TaxID=1385975 RepID=A0A7X0H5R4_9BACT|nr:paraquat-inducible protein A [Algisphaera agarilytica]MBB6429792.1 paraquat-inducible protein A [Algisphaera agarilytica]
MIQTLPGYPAGKAKCRRCDYTLRHRSPAGPIEAMFWVLLLLGCMLVATQDLFMSFTFASGQNRIAIIHPPIDTIRLGGTAVGMAVLFCTVVGPILWGLGMLYVCGGLAARMPGPGTAGILRSMHKLRPWVMLEVFLLGVLVTAGKLGHEGHLDYGRGFHLFLAALAVWIIIARRVKPHRFWELLQPSVDCPHSERAEVAPEGTDPCMTADTVVGCQTCGLAQRIPRCMADHELSCQRCGAEINEDEHKALVRSVVLVGLAAVLLLPANLVPIMRIAELGPPEPATVWEGIKVLYFGGSPALAALVFVASLCVPIAKVFVIIAMLLCRHPRRASTARCMTKLHRFVATIGRWSMVDMFVVALLIGLVRLGSLASVDPKPGAIAFLAVVVITIAAAEEINPRVFWSRTKDST